MKPKMQVGIWIRVSTEDQAQGESPEHHEERARAYAKFNNWEIVTVYHLEAVSGKSVMEHPEAKRMLREVRSGAIQGLIFSKLARLARNTIELLKFSDIFQECGASLVSLQESIDTSTPAGRLFYTVIAAMAQWEREEISSRVAASVPIRAELGKPLGGAAPFGYTWKGKELQINPTEAPIRKQMYDLFLLHRRLHVVANELNKLGHRTRNGSKFTHTTIERLLRDPMAKGFRRANYTKSRGEKKHWDLKPESEWVITPCPAIVTEEVWAQCNEIIEGRVSKRTKAPRKSVHLFSGTLMCGCGGKMYVPSRVSKYVCQDCKQTHISTEDIEEIYFEQLRGFLLSKDELPTFIARTEAAMEAAQIGFESANSEKVKVREQMDGIIKLHSLGQIPTDRFKEYYAPLDEQFRQLGNTVERHAAELDYLKVQMLNGDHILSNAEDLYDRWPKMSKEEKRQTVEELTRSIVIDGEDITITFSYAPPLLENTPTAERNLMDSYWPLT